VFAEQSNWNGWTSAEALKRVPDLARCLAEGIVLAWGRIGSPGAELSSIPRSIWLEADFPDPESADAVLISGGARVFDLQIFPIIRSPQARQYLHGLSLGEAFRKYVVADCEIVGLGRRLTDLHPSVFLEGQAPGPMVDFHWQLGLTAKGLAYRFVDSPMKIMGARQPVASPLEVAASEILADRIAGLVDFFARGDAVAIGTFAATGVEVAISAGQWRRKDLLVDVENSSLCELRNHNRNVLWTGVMIRDPEARMPHETGVAKSVAEQLPKPKQTQTKANARDECAAWLKSLFSDPSVLPRTNTVLCEEAKRRWSNKLSKREFDRCRANALGSIENQELRRRWEGPGPKPKSPQF
jgi:hypothetical protein